LSIVSNAVQLFSQNFNIGTLQGKVSTLLWFLFAVFWIIHFIFDCIKLGEDDFFKLRMKFEPVELFPQFAICPMFQEEGFHFSGNVECHQQQWGSQQRTPIVGDMKTFTHTNPPFSETCMVYNTKADLVIGNNTVFCAYIISSPKDPRRFGDAMIHYSQAGDPNWFFGGNTPNGPNWYRAASHSFNMIGVEAFAYSDEDDGGYKQIKYNKVFEHGHDLRLPTRSYRVYGRAIGNPGEDWRRNNHTELMQYWQTQDLWMYQHGVSFDFWGWTAYLGGCAFLMVMLHSLIMNILRIVWFGVEQEGTNSNGFQRL